MIKTSSLPLKKVLELIQVPFGEEYSFILKDSSIKRADKFIHNMRVELSRLREKVRTQHKRTTTPFKVLRRSVELIPNGKVYDAKVVLMRTQNDTNIIEQEVDSQLETILGGTYIQ